MTGTEAMPRTVVVTPHAIQQFLTRNPDRRGSDIRLIRRWISDEVRVALAEGRVQNHKTDGFLLYGQKRRQLPNKQRFVTSADGRYGWIIAREPNGDDVVVTSLTRAGVRR